MDRKLKLAIISSYEDSSCANATYARLLEKVLAAHFDVTVFPLNSDLMKPRELISAADKYIEEVCQKLQNFDFVNLHQELGLYGYTADEMIRRIIKLCDASSKLIYTMHGLEVGTGIFPDTYKTILLNLRNRPQNKPYHIITHTEIQRKQVERIFGIFNTTDYPVTYITKHEKDRVLSIDKKEWKTKRGFTGTDILIGTFGAWNESKNRIWLLKTLEILPDNYKLIFFGRMHPLSIQKFKVNDNTKLIIDFFEERLQKNINRIRCFGVITDDSLFNEAMSYVDFREHPIMKTGNS